jgi:hypothetical protein
MGRTTRDKGFPCNVMNELAVSRIRMANSKRRPRPGAKRGVGRPRVNAPGSRPAYTNISPAVAEAVERLAAERKWSSSLMISQLLEEALKARGELK